jgi:23S rRNA (guanosine2251-2'-O)-methyltransferase
MKKLANAELNRLSQEEIKRVSRTPVYIILDNVRSMHNVGSVFRTSDAFLVSGILLCGITGCPPHREIQKTSLGAEKTVPWLHFENTKDAVLHVREKKCRIYAVEQAESSIDLNDFIPDNDMPYAFVFGNEVNGVAQEIVNLADACIEIPQFGCKHSFNIAVTTAIVLWHYSHKNNEKRSR